MERWSLRDLLGLSIGAMAAVARGRFFVSELSAQAPTIRSNTFLQTAFGALDDFVRDYMRAMDAPGMTLAIANRDGIVRIATYGFADLERRAAVQPDQLFEIGSITKSFVAIAILQLAEEKKIDLHRPIRDFMPWLKVESRFEPITVHHLLTHTSGLPESLSCLLSDPAASLHPRYAPGQHFLYCNLAYQALGYLLWQVDRRPFAEAIRQRILTPIGMTSTEPVISGDTRRREPRSYNAWLDDRPFVPGAPLKPAPPLIIDDAAGSIASTPRDMGLYIQMLANRGRAGSRRILADESFAQMIAPHAKAEVFGAGVSYGYGLMIDRLDGHTIVRHTGGMVSFASAMQIDLDEGVGVFASINAMQGFRPNPVAQYALELMRAANARHSPPPPAAIATPQTIPNAADYGGVFTSPSGKRLEFVAQNHSLSLLAADRKLPVEISGGQLVVHDDELGRWALNFQRDKGEGSPVTDLIHGREWYAGAQYSGPREFHEPPEWRAYTGHYHNDSPLSGGFRVVSVKGRLWIDGVIPLEPAGVGVFWLNDPPYNPGRIEFFNRIGDVCMQAKLSGEDFWRAMIA